MGACFETYQVKATNKRDAEREVLALIKQSQYDNGHAGYTGTIAEADGLKFLDTEASSEAEAEDLIDSATQKWGPAAIVRIKGSDIWVVGGVFSS